MPIARGAGGDGLPADRDARHGRGAARARASPVEEVPKMQEGRPNLLDHMKNGGSRWSSTRPAARAPGPTRAGSARGGGQRRHLHHDPGGRPGRGRGVPGLARASGPSAPAGSLPEMTFGPRAGPHGQPLDDRFTSSPPLLPARSERS